MSFWDNAIPFVDLRGDKYKFRFTCVEGRKFIYIDITFKMPVRLGLSSTTGVSFSQPIHKGIIFWNEYGGPKGRKDILSVEAITFAERLAKLIAFI